VVVCIAELVFRLPTASNIVNHGGDFGFLAASEREPEPKDPKELDNQYDEDEHHSINAGDIMCFICVIAGVMCFICVLAGN
jgi:hypothetical protein